MSRCWYWVLWAHKRGSNCFLLITWPLDRKMCHCSGDHRLLGWENPQHTVLQHAKDHGKESGNPTKNVFTSFSYCLQIHHCICACSFLIINIEYFIMWKQYLLILMTVIFIYFLLVFHYIFTVNVTLGHFDCHLFKIEWVLHLYFVSMFCPQWLLMITVCFLCGH